MKKQTLIEQIIKEGGNPSNTEVYDKNGTFMCIAGENGYNWNDMNASMFKLFAHEHGNWIAVLKAKELIKLV